MSDPPTVTVLMAVHDGERHLRESIDSVLAQTFGDLELLVVNDASADGTASILGAYDDPRIRVLTNAENRGLPRSLNRGLEHARGRYVARQDDDDVSEPTRLERQVAFLERHPDVALLASAYRRIDDDGRVTGDRPVPLEPVAIRWRLLFLNAFAHSSVVLRRDVLERLGRYSDEYPFAQDYELWSRISRDARVAALPEPLLRYRESPSSMTGTQAAGVDDVERISRDNLRRLGIGRLADELDLDAARRLLFGTRLAVDVSRGRRAARQVLAVERAFAARERLGVRARTRHRAAVAFQLARALREARGD